MMLVDMVDCQVNLDTQVDQERNHLMILIQQDQGTDLT